MSKRLNRDDIDKMHDYGLYVPTRTIYMGSEEVDMEIGESGTDAAMAERVIKNLHILDNAASEPITIIMNNLGGYVFHGMAIYDAIKKCRSHITIIGTGQVMSMGSLILQAADKRVLTPSAVMMIHHGYDHHDNHIKTIRNWVKFGEKFDEILNDIYFKKIKEKNSDFNRKKLDKLLDFDTILLASEAVSLGLADEIEEYQTQTS
jgi:ATP-dependent protease ClpP protease subunit